MGRVLSLDYGAKWVGVALSDESALNVFPRQPIINRSQRQLFTAIAKLVRDEQVEKIVVGLPLTLRGERGHQAQHVQSIMCQLEELLNIPVDFEDERLTSAYASRFPSARSSHSLAAAVLLESYLARTGRQRQ